MCGIFPFNPEVVLSRIPVPNAQDDVPDEWSQRFVDLLQAKRFTEEPTRKRGKKLNVAPGKAIQHPRRRISSSSSSEPDLSNEDAADERFDSESENESELDEEVDENENNNEVQGPFENPETAIITTDTFVIVKLTNEKTTKNYVACVKEVVDQDTYVVHFLRKHESSKIGDYYTYPQTKDESVIERRQLTLVLRSVKDARRGKYQFKFPGNISTS